MNIINLKKILNGMTKAERIRTARQLFPTNQFAERALVRVAEGNASLDEVQIAKLSELTGISITDLFEGVWKAEYKKKVHIFKSGRYRAELNTDTWVTKIFDENTLFYEDVIHSGVTPVSQYLEELNSLISKQND